MGYCTYDQGQGHGATSKFFSIYHKKTVKSAVALERNL